VDKNSFLKKIDDMISSIFSSSLKEEVEEPQEEEATSPQNIEEYTELTGKRFRMTKCQKEMGLTRQEAFEDFINTNWRK
jgi:ferritin-like metal-binding protein YciE